MARTFLLRFRTDDDDGGAIRRLRNTLKTAWRRDRLKCVSAEEILEARCRSGVSDNSETEQPDD
jgi:hypothetical protein